MSLQSSYKSKSGIDIMIRPARISDAEALVQLKLGYIRNTKTIPLFEDEYKNSIKDEEAFITKLQDEKNSLLLLAEHDGELLGNIDLNGNQRRKLYHTAMIGMGIAYKWQGTGIGTMLMHETLKYANNNKHLKIIWLDVYESNQAGKRLYKNAGFEVCGRIEGFFIENGKSIDNIKMVKYL